MVVTSARFYWPLLSVSACGCRSLPPISSNACRLLPCPPPPHVRAAFSYDRSAQPGDARASHMTIGTSHMTIGTGTGTGGPQAAAQPQRTRDFREIEFTGPLRRPVKSAWNEMDAEDSGCASPTAASPHPQPHRLTRSRIASPTAALAGHGHTSLLCSLPRSPTHPLALQTRQSSYFRSI